MNLERIEAAAHIQKFLIQRKFKECETEASKETVIADVLQLAEYILRQCKDQSHRKKSTNKVVNQPGGEEVNTSKDVTDISLLSHNNPSKDTAVGFDRLLSKLLSPSRNIHNTSTKVPPVVEEHEGFVSAFGTPDRHSQNFHHSLSPVFPRMDLSSVDRTDEDDDDEDVGFELLQSVDDWASLKHFVRDGIATKKKGEITSLVVSVVHNNTKDENEKSPLSPSPPPKEKSSSSSSTSSSPHPSSSSSSSSSSLLPIQKQTTAEPIDDHKYCGGGVVTPLSNFDQNHILRNPSGKILHQKLSTNKKDLRKSWSLRVESSDPTPDPNKLI
jgi:hypothetical protein